MGYKEARRSGTGADRATTRHARGGDLRSVVDARAMGGLTLLRGAVRRDAMGEPTLLRGAVRRDACEIGALRAACHAASGGLRASRSGIGHDDALR